MAMLASLIISVLCAMLGFFYGGFSIYIFYFPNWTVPQSATQILMLQGLYWAAIPAAVLGLLFGASVNSTYPRGYIGKVAGPSTWLIGSVLAWVSQFRFLTQMSAGGIILAVLSTLMWLMIAPKVCEWLGYFIEGIRE
jgi:hypothetical protein